MTRALPRSTPHAHGVSAAAVLAFIDALENQPGVEPHSLMLLRHGCVVAEGWWHPYSPERVQLLYSLSKSFTATALGLAHGDGLVQLDDLVLPSFPEIAPDDVDERLRQLRVRHLAAMATGHLEDTWHLGPSSDPVNPVRAFFALPPEREPGTVFTYNQSATYTLAALVQRAVGCTLSEILSRRIIGPAGLSALRWLQHPDGQDLGFSGLHATTETIAALGELYRRGGLWHGERLLPPGWTDEASRMHIPTVRPDKVASADWSQGYGFQFWRSQHGYRGDGAYGQFCLVLPEYDVVLAMTGQSPDMQAVLDATWNVLLPGLGADEATPTGAEEALAERLSSLTLATRDVLPASAVPREGWMDRILRPSDGPSPSARAAIEALSILPGDGTPEIQLKTAGDCLHLPLGAPWHAGRWDAGGAPVAVSAGWTSDSSLSAEVIFLETPHRLNLTCTLPDGTFRAAWQTQPLHDLPLQEMCAPPA